MKLNRTELRVLASARVILVNYAADVFTPHDVSEHATQAANQIDEVLDFVTSEEL